MAGEKDPRQVEGERIAEMLAEQLALQIDQSRGFVLWLFDCNIDGRRANGEDAFLAYCSTVPSEDMIGMLRDQLKRLGAE